jgi:hypothetical protein
MKTQTFTHPLIVVDQNKLRSPEAIYTALDRCCRENLRLLIPDGAFFEMSKSKNAFDTWRRSLKELAPYHELVVVSAKMTQLMQAEVAQRCSCRELTSADGTAFVRRLLAEIHLGNLTTLTAIIEGPLQQKLPASTAVWSDFAQHKANIQRVRDLLNLLSASLELNFR